MSRRLLPTLLMLVVWLAGVNHCALSLLFAARSGDGVAVCSHCGPAGAPQPAHPRGKSCCQDLRAELAQGAVKVAAPVSEPLSGGECLRARLALAASSTSPLISTEEESPPGFFLSEVLQSSLAAHAPPIVG